MAKDNGFYLFTQYGNKLKRLTDEQFGQLIRFLIEYKETGMEPEIEDMAVGMGFDVIREDIDRQAEEYAKKSNAGRLGGEAKQKEAEPSTPKQTEADRSTSKQDEAEPSYKKEKEKEKEKENTPNGVQKKFARPTVEEVRAYCAERGNRVDAQNFWDFYEAKGWKVGNQPMKDWKACVRTWEKRETARSGTRGFAMQRPYDPEIEKLLGVI